MHVDGPLTEAEALDLVQGRTVYTAWPDLDVDEIELPEPVTTPRPAASARASRVLPDDEQCLYDSGVVDGWIKRWGELVALCECVRSPADIGSAVKPQGGRTVRDGRSFAVVRADLERAVDDLPDGSLARDVIVARMRWGAPFSDIARRLGKRKADVCAAYRDGVERMVETLNGDAD